MLDKPYMYNLYKTQYGNIKNLLFHVKNNIKHAQTSEKRCKLDNIGNFKYKIQLHNHRSL